MKHYKKLLYISLAKTFSMTDFKNMKTFLKYKVKGTMIELKEI